MFGVEGSRDKSTVWLRTCKGSSLFDLCEPLLPLIPSSSVFFKLAVSASILF